MKSIFQNKRMMLVIYGGLIIASIGLIVYNLLITNIVSITTSEAMKAATKGEIVEFKYTPLKESISGEMKSDKQLLIDKNIVLSKDETTVAFTTVVDGEQTFNKFVRAAEKGNPDVKWNIISSVPGLFETILSFIPTFLMVLLILLAFKVVMSNSKGTGGLLNFGKSKARLNDNDDEDKTTFDDVAGCDEAVYELREIKEFLESPDKFKALGAKIPKGVLLVGPPGTGKTLLAKAVAGESGVPFFTVSGSDFVEMFVGVGSSRIRDTFAKAKAAAPAIVFIDEIDAVGGKRGGGIGGNSDEREQTLNALLVEMDGFNDKETVIVMAATNRADILDPALLRPGRFDRQIVVDRPDKAGREKILKIHSANKPLNEDVCLTDLARTSAGMSGADLANLVNEAALLAARNNSSTIRQVDFKEAMERVIAGLEKKERVLNDKERLIVAYHESGHAIVGHLTDGSDPVNKVTILPRGRSLGYTLSIPEEDTFLDGKNELKADLIMLLGGRAAEEIVFGDITTGASNDIERASRIAYKMVTQFGMSDTLGPRSFVDAVGQETNGISERIAAVIDDEVSSLINDSYKESKSILINHKGRLEKMCKVLLEKETIEGDELQDLLNGVDGLE